MSRGWNEAPDYTPQGNFWRDQLLVIILLLAGVIVTVVMASRAKAERLQVSTVIKTIYWSDADSGKINGKIKFRLNSVDAPETGGVGAAIGGAKCELERERGYEAKEWMVGFTRNVEVSITQEYGLDKYERLVLDLSVSGEGLDQVGITLGYLKPWPHKGRKALSKKPDWCG